MLASMSLLHTVLAQVFPNRDNYHTHTHTFCILTPCHWVGKCFMNGLSVMYSEHLALLE